MSKNNKKELVPELRFPEFQGEWEKKELGGLSKILRGGSPRPIDEFITIESSGLNWLKIADVNKNSKYVTSTKEKVLVAALSKTREVHPGDLIMSNSMSFGRPYIMKIKSCIHDGWIAITEIDGKIYRDYLYYLILSPTSQAYFLANAAGSGVKNLNADIIKLLPISFSIRIEQQKIADCLSSLDELIAANTQKHQVLQTYKKGLLQNLFPAEGETVPALRFPEFLDAGDWEDKPLKKVFSIFQGYAFSSNDTVKEGARWLKIADVGIQFMNHKSPSFLPIKHTAQHKRYLVKKGDHVVALTRPFLSGRLKIAVVDDVFHEALLNQRVGKVVALQNSSFVYYLLQTTRLISEIEKSIAGSEPPNLSAQQIEDVETYIPSKEEQKKIADLLSSVDDLINAQAQKIDDLKVHKKGLMQQLFPAMDGVEA